MSDPLLGQGSSDEERLAYAEVEVMLRHLKIYPLGLVLPSMGLTASTFLQKIGGLSAARVSQGNLDKLRPSTLVKMKSHALTKAIETGLSNGIDGEEVRRRFQSAPICSNSEEAGFASLLHFFQSPDELLLPKSIAVALSIDELLQELSAAHRSRAVAPFRLAIQNFLLEQEWCTLPSVCEKAFKDTLQDWEAASDWITIQAQSDKFFLELVFSFFAAIDVEWADQYFAGTCVEPVFALVSPKPIAKLLAGAKVGRKDALLVRPVRRLLELSAALIHHHYKEGWLSSRPHALELAEWMSEKDSDSDHFYNYLDGSKSFTAADFLSCWKTMCKNISGEDAMLQPPLLLCVVAIGWQSSLIKRNKNKKITSFVYFTDADQHHWLMYRKRWQGHLQVAEQTFKWPDWLLN